MVIELNTTTAFLWELVDEESLDGSFYEIDRPEGKG